MAEKSAAAESGSGSPPSQAAAGKGGGDGEGGVRAGSPTPAHGARAGQDMLLLLSVHQARGLLATDHVGTDHASSDPYVIARYAEVERSTDWIEQNLNPEWQSHFAYDVAPEDMAGGESKGDEDDEAMSPRVRARRDAMQGKMMLMIFDHEDFHDDDVLGKVEIQLPQPLEVNRSILDHTWVKVMPAKDAEQDLFQSRRRSLTRKISRNISLFRQDLDASMQLGEIQLSLTCISIATLPTTMSAFLSTEKQARCMRASLRELSDKMEAVLKTEAERDEELEWEEVQRGLVSESRAKAADATAEISQLELSAVAVAAAGGGGGRGGNAQQQRARRASSHHASPHVAAAVEAIHAAAYVTVLYDRLDSQHRERHMSNVRLLDEHRERLDVHDRDARQKAAREREAEEAQKKDPTYAIRSAFKSAMDDDEEYDYVSLTAAVLKVRFWVRVAVWVLSMLAFSVMASFKHIDSTELDACDVYNGKNCGLLTDCTEFDGSFDLSPYRYVIAAGVLLWLWTMFLLFIYACPVNDDTEKAFPFTTKPLPRWLTGHTLAKWRLWGDIVMIVLAGIAFIAGTASVETSEKFHITTLDPDNFNIYFTLNTFFESYSKCVGENPVGHARSACALLFFAVLLHGFALEASVRSHKRHQQSQGSGGGANAGSLVYTKNDGETKADDTGYFA